MLLQLTDWRKKNLRFCPFGLLIYLCTHSAQAMKFAWPASQASAVPVPGLACFHAAIKDLRDFPVLFH